MTHHSLQGHFTVTAEQVALYADVADDHNPLHLDEAFARERGFPGAIVHGLLTLGLISTVLGDGLGGRWTSGGTIDARFSAPVPVGSTVQVRAVPAGEPCDGICVYEVEARVDGTVVVKASASVRDAS